MTNDEKPLAVFQPETEKSDEKPISFFKPETEKPSMLSAGLTAAARGFTFDFWDEIKALYGAGVADYLAKNPDAISKYEELVKKYREEQKAAEEAHPIVSLAGQAAGSLPYVLVPGVGAAKGATLAGQIGKQAVAGAGYGALSGAGAGENVESRLAGAQTGAGLGAAFGAAAPVASKAVSFAYEKTLKPAIDVARGYLSPDKMVASGVAKTLMDDQALIKAGKSKGLTLEDWQAAKAAGEPVTLADLGGPNTQSLIKRISETSPEAYADLENVFETRFRNQGERIAADIRRLTGSEANAARTSDQILAEYDAKRFPAYQKAYSNPNAEFMYDKELQNYVNSFKDPKGSSKFISDAIQNGYDEAVKQAVFNNRPRPEYYSLEHWDYIRREISKDSGAWKKAEELNKILDAKVPEYKEARGLVTNYFGEKNALEAGQKLAGKNISTEELKKTLRKLSPEELEIFKEGYASDLSNRIIKNMSETRDLVKSVYHKPGEKEKILAIFGPDGARKLEDRMALEAIFQGSRKALGSSTRAKEAIKQGLMYGSLGGLVGGYYGGLSPESILSGAALGVSGRKAAAIAARSMKGTVSENLAEKVATLLTSDNPDEFKRGMELVSKNETFRKYMRNVANQFITATAVETTEKSSGGSVTHKMHMANGGTPFAGSSNPNKVYNPITKRFELIDPKHWTKYDKTWNSLNNYQKAAVMSLMEADKTDPEDAKNILGAIVNRAARSKEDLGTHVSKKIYQPTFEPTQRARLNRLLKHPALPELIDWVERRSQGLEPDNVGGATHYLAPETVMLALERKNPKKYKNWGPRGQNWTGFDTKTGSYRNVTMRDKSHAFLAPEGKYSAPYVAPQQVAGEIPPILQSQTRNDRARLAQMTEEASKPTQVASEIPPILQSQTHEERDRARLAQLADEAAQPTQTATVPEKNKELSPDDYAKFLQAIQGFMKGQEQLPAPVAPMPQAPKPEIPIVRPYGMAQGGGTPDLPGGSVEDYLYMPEMEQGSPIQASIASKEANISGNLRGSLGPISGNIGGYAFKSGPVKGGGVSNIGIQYNPDEDTTFSGEYYKEGDQGFGVMGRGSIRYAMGGTVTDRMHQARKKKVDGGSATSDDMTWGDVAEQYKQNIGPDVEKQATNYLLDQYKAFKDPLGTLKSAGQGLYNVGKGAYDIGVGLGSKALGSLDYEPTGDVKYHRELPLEKAIEGVKNFDVKKYIAEHPAEATSQGLGLATGVGALGRKVAMSPLTREFLANESGSVPLGKTSGIKGYHGSPHSFEKFDASKIGTGEGAQAYGHGLYFAESEPVAKNYYNNLTYKKIRNDFLDALPEDADFSEVTSLLGTKHFTPQQEDLIKALKKDDWFGFDYPSQAINAALNRKQNLVDMFDASPETVEAVKNLGNMYEVNIKAEPHQFIDLDKTLSEQPEMSEVISSMANLTKEQQEKLPMKDVLKLLGRPKEVSEKFHKAGIQGYKYFDALSREKGEGNRNYVVFNPEIVDVLRKYEKGGSVTEKMLWRKKRSKKH